MSFVEHDLVQLSDEWHAIRLGRVCASRAADVFATLKSGGESASRRNYRVQLVLERLMQRPLMGERFQSQAMLDGIEREEAALALYEAQRSKLLRRVGFVSHRDLLAGASPDGVCGAWEHFVEAKSPIPATHLDYLKTGKVPDDYYKQMRHLAWLTDCWRGVFVSYQPEFPPDLQLKIVDVTFHPDELEQHGRAVKQFLAEVDQELATVKTLTNLRGTLEASVA